MGNRNDMMDLLFMVMVRKTSYRNRGLQVKRWSTNCTLISSGFSNFQIPAWSSSAGQEG